MVLSRRKEIEIPPERATLGGGARGRVKGGARGRSGREFEKISW